MGNGGGNSEKSGLGTKNIIIFTLFHGMTLLLDQWSRFYSVRSDFISLSSFKHIYISFLYLRLVDLVQITFGIQNVVSTTYQL